MSPVKLEETITLDFITSNSTGAATDADSLPTCAVYEDDNDTAIVSPTVTKRTGLTGNYRASIPCTATNGFEAGKSYNVIASATVGGVAAKACIASFQVRTNSVDDSVTLSAASIQAIWNALTSALTAVGSIGALLVSKLNLISSTSITVRTPVAENGDISELLAGDDYYAADGRALEWDFTGQPDWTGATPVLYVNTPTPIEATGTVSGAGAATQTLIFQLSSTETARGTIPDGRDLETYSFEISVTLSSGHETTPRRGKATFKRQLG